MTDYRFFIHVEYPYAWANGYTVFYRGDEEDRFDQDVDGYLTQVQDRGYGQEDSMRVTYGKVTGNVSMEHDGLRHDHI